MKRTLLVICFGILVEENHALMRVDNIENDTRHRQMCSGSVVQTVVSFFKSLFGCCKSNPANGFLDPGISNNLTAAALGNNVTIQQDVAAQSGNINANSRAEISNSPAFIGYDNDDVDDGDVGIINRDENDCSNALNISYDDTDMQRALLDDIQANRTVGDIINNGNAIPGESSLDCCPITLEDFANLQSTEASGNFFEGNNLGANGVKNTNENQVVIDNNHAITDQLTAPVVKGFLDNICDNYGINVDMQQIQQRAIIELSDKHKVGDLIGYGKQFATIDDFNASCQSELIKKIPNHILKHLLIANSFGNFINIDTLLAEIYQHTAEILGIEQSVYEQLEEMKVIQWSYNAGKLSPVAIRSNTSQEGLTDLLSDIDPGLNSLKLIRRIKNVNKFLALVYDSVKNTVVVSDDSVVPDEYIHNVSIDSLANTYSMLDFDSVEDTFFLKLSESSQNLPILTLPKGCSNHYVILKHTYDGLVGEDKRGANKLIIAAYKRRFTQISREIMGGSTSYFFSIRDKACYRPLYIRPGYRISKQKRLYSMNALRKITSDGINNASPKQLMSLLQQLILKAIWLCLEENSVEQFPYEINVFKRFCSSNKRSILASIRNALNLYLSNKKKSDWFHVVIGAVSDDKTQSLFRNLQLAPTNAKKSAIKEELLNYLMEQIEDCLSNISSCRPGECGVFFNETQVRYVIDKFQDLIDNLELIRYKKGHWYELSSMEMDTTDKALTIVGLLFQSFQHCRSGQYTGMINVFSLLVNFGEVDNIDFSSLTSCICGIVARRIALDVFQFKDENNRDHHESASFFARSMDLLNGRYGLSAPGAGQWFDGEQLKWLYKHIARNHSYIIEWLDARTKHALTVGHSDTATENVRTAVCNIFAVAMNMLFIDTLLKPEYRELLKLLIQAYAKATNRIHRDWVPSSPEVFKKLVEEILYEHTLLEYAYT
ncbi:MAG: hypothetical protein LBT90_01935 [Holosporaceae bacterium]|jgi:hypothetical protein|nr:hypothetical protein [Holosporaceae bacterium]